FANPHTTTGARPQTNVPSQSLFMMNDPLVMDTAAITAKRLLAEMPDASTEVRVQQLFELLTGIPPTDEELRAMSRFVETMAEQFRSDVGTESATGDSADRDSTTRDSTARDSVTDAASAELQAMTLACHAVFASSRFQFLE
ncbi:MAG: DUF1553 domain-containing protein, partial [Planctomycetaceae bacterium]|nr:DUF1553 domain-containing protein [Planctomycetaceae bacterium]